MNSGSASENPPSDVAHRIRQHIKLQIPPKYAQEPIISNLTTRYEVEVNITSALLATNSQESGWFDLELHGTPARIQQALTYLSTLQVEILDSGNSTASNTSWSYH